MESPFFRNHWNYQPQRPRYVPGMVEVPAHRRTVPVAPKVVSIPVRFVESTTSRSDSATKIQKVFRGFLVRKSLKKVVAIEREVNEIGRRLAKEETVESIRRDTKERVRFGEMLMSLLFRLDSVKGVESGIRNYRKAVIKKAIALQEKVDSIAAAECDSEAVDRSSEIGSSGPWKNGVEETPKIEDGISEREDENYADDDIANSESAVDREGDKREVKYADFRDELEDADEVTSNGDEGAIIEESAPHSTELNLDLEVPVAEDVLEQPQLVSEHGENSPGEGELKMPEEVDNDMVHREIEAMSEAESETDSSNNPPNSDDGVAEEFGAVDEGEDSRIKGREDDEQSRELLEKMMVDNKKMMEMMAHLFEKNEMQSRLLCSLSHRVEQLEKAVVYEMLRKKRNCSGKGSPKSKKNGK